MKRIDIETDEEFFDDYMSEEMFDVLAIKPNDDNEEILPMIESACYSCISKSGNSMCGSYCGCENINGVHYIVHCTDLHCITDIDKNNLPTEKQIYTIKKECNKRNYKYTFWNMSKGEAGQIILYLRSDKEIEKPECYDYYIEEV